MKILSILIALTLLYALFSIIASSLVEWYNQKFKTRGKLLREAIDQFLDSSQNKELKAEFYSHPLVKNMESAKSGRPMQYLADSIFADALIDIISKKAPAVDPAFVALNYPEQIPVNPSLDNPEVLRRFKAGVEQLNPGDFKEMLSDLALKNTTYSLLKKALQDWYNNFMARVNGWFKRKQKTVLMVSGFVIAIAFNIDSIHLFRVISMDQELRDELVQMAEKVEGDYAKLNEGEKKDLKNLTTILYTYTDSAATAQNFTKVDSMRLTLVEVTKQFKLTDSLDQYNLTNFNKMNNAIDNLGLPVGWDKNEPPLAWFYGPQEKIESDLENPMYNYIIKRSEKSWVQIALYFIGIIISGISLSLGAPFWFDTLSKLVNIRKAGAKPTPEK